MTTRTDDPFRRFIAEHPEWADETREVELPEGLGLIGSTNCMRAFVNWLVDKRMVPDVDKARRFRAFIDRVQADDDQNNNT